MREANAWLGDEEIGYFDHPGGYLSYTPQIPADVDLKIFTERSHPAARDDTFPPIETTSEAIVEAHAKLVKFQLQAGGTTIDDGDEVVLRRVALTFTFSHVHALPRLSCLFLSP